MKRFSILLIAAALMLCLAACDLIPIDTDPYGTDVPSVSPSISAAATSTQTPAAAPTATATLTIAPTATPTIMPSPSPTATQQPQTQTEYEKLMAYCRDYLDVSAAVEIKDMYSGREITGEQFEALFDVFPEMEYYNSSNWAQTEDEVRSLSDIINGRKMSLGEDEGESFYETMVTLPQQGAAYINLFDTQLKQDRVKAAVELIKKWYAEPTDENFNSFDEAYHSADLTPGEVFMLGYYMYYGKGMPASIEADGTTIKTIDFLSRQDYLEYADNAYYELIDINNGKS